jgi:hypothetical protein
MHVVGLSAGVTAANWSASEFHWPHVDQIGDGLGEKVWGKPGEPDAVSWQMLYMGLAGSKFHAARPPWAGGEGATGNVYGDSRYDVVRPQGGPWPMIDDTFGGQMMGQVRFPAVFDRGRAVCIPQRREMGRPISILILNVVH